MLLLLPVILAGEQSWIESGSVEYAVSCLNLLGGNEKRFAGIRISDQEYGQRFIEIGT